MAISTFDQYIAAPKQTTTYTKTAARTTVAVSPFSMLELAGLPGAGVLAGTSVNGVVPDSTTVGFPGISVASGVNYITRIAFANTVASRIILTDLLFKAGAYNFAAGTTTLASQPSYAARLPNTDYTGLAIWIETVVASTGIPSIVITYTNQAGVTGRTTGVISLVAAQTVGRLFQMPLQAGDTGVQKIESVTTSVATAGTFNILVTRQLFSGRVVVANSGDTFGIDRTGMPIIYQTTALYPIIIADATSTGLPDLQIEIATA